MELAGYQFIKESSDFDESNRPSNISPENLAQWLAWQKAQKVLSRRQARGDRNATVIAADTFCVLEDEILEKPRDRLRAKEMLQKIVGREHEVITGVCLINQESNDAFLILDRATVFLKELSEHSLETYLNENTWKLKAGGYDYKDRQIAGWPLKCSGDITAVQGLPMNRLKTVLNFLNIHPVNKK